MSRNVIIKIGDVAISIEGQVSGEIAPAYLPFIAQGKTDISLRLHHGLPEIVVEEKVFEFGIHEILWEGKDDAGNVVPSGCYIYRIESEKYKAAGKMIFMK